jgi:N-acetyl-anhydromuramyl-L-alanine amidase AmpD
MDYSKYTNYKPLDKMTKVDNFPTEVILHHSASLVDNFNSIQSYHITDPSHLWENIGYHWIIERGGALKQGRPENYHGAHVKEDGVNSRSIGICLCGDIDKKLPDEGQIATLKNLLYRISKQYNISPDNVYPHRHYALNASGKPYKSCFGNLLKDDFGSNLLKEELAKDSSVLVSGTTAEVPVEAPKLTTTDVSSVDKVLDYMVTSSRNPEEWSMTVKAFIVAQLPIAIYFFKTVGINLDSNVVIELVNNLALGLSLVMGVFGLVRKIYFWSKSFIEAIKPIINKK